MSTDPKTVYEAVVDELQATSPAVPGKTFGMPALKIGTKVFAGFAGDGMVFKLPDSARAEALALPGAHSFDPAGMSRPVNNPTAKARGLRLTREGCRHRPVDCGPLGAGRRFC